MSAASGTSFLLLTLALVLVGCSHPREPQVPTADERLRHTLTGTWTNNSGIMVLELDGSFWAHYETRMHPLHVWGYEGSWTATNHVLVFTCTNSRSWGTPYRGPTGTDILPIVSLDDQTLRLAGPYQTNSYTRAN